MAAHGRRRWIMPLESELPWFDNEPWMKDGACAAAAPAYDLFFGEDPAQEREAKERFCSVCPVAYECLDFSIRKNEIYGIWGGMTFKERCQLTQRYRGHTSHAARSAHRRQLTELNRKRQLHADRPRRVRPRR